MRQISKESVVLIGCYWRGWKPIHVGKAKQKNTFMYQSIAVAICVHTHTQRMAYDLLRWYIHSRAAIIDFRRDAFVIDAPIIYTSMIYSFEPHTVLYILLYDVEDSFHTTISHRCPYFGGGW